MKVSGTGATAATGVASRANRASGDGFAPSASDAAHQTAATGATSSVSSLGSLDALLALQETLTPTERRKRALRRAGGLLDALDQIKLSILEEGDPRHALDRLQSLARNLRDQTDDAGLEEVLNEVDLRAEVELAKDEMVRKGKDHAA